MGQERGVMAPDSGGATQGASIDIRNVRKLYGDFAAVDDVSLMIHPGEFLTLLGPSGSGKTTLLNMIAGFAYPDAGEILIDGVPIGNTPPYKRGIGVVLQNYALFPHMSVVANVEFGLKMRRVDAKSARQRAEQALELVGMEGHAQKMPAQLSGGQQQRIALARALVFQPRIILMDEPLSALDRRLRDRLKMEIKDLHRRLSSTIVYVTHDQSEALTMSDRVAVLDEGKLLSITDPVSMYNSPSMEFVANFLGESNQISGRLVSGERLQVGDSVVSLTGQVAEYSEGDLLEITVRPERLGLVEEAQPGALRCKVMKLTFLGEMYRVDALVSGTEQVIQARVPNTMSDPPCAVGQDVGFMWEPDQIASIRRAK